MPLSSLVRPNATVTRNTARTISLGWVAWFALAWIALTLGPNVQQHVIPQLPGPADVAKAFATGWEDTVWELLKSTFLSLKAVSLASVIGLTLAYLSTLPLFRAPIVWISKLRFLSLAGVLVVFWLVTKGGMALKISVLTFSVVTFLLNDLLQLVDDVPKAKFNYARTLGLKPWVVLREVVVRNTLPGAFEAIRMNAAMAWMMLTLVEGLSQEDGGIGVRLIHLQRAGDYASIFSIQLLILLVGMGQDQLIKLLKLAACPYVERS